MKKIRFAGVALALVSSVAMAQSAGDTYKAKCAMCHGADGTAATSIGKSMKIASFKSPEMIKLSDAAMIASTKNGKGKMPAYAGKLSDSQIKAVVAYIRTLQK